MPKLDQCHDQIVHALQKAGWDVSQNPYVLPVAGKRRFFIDIYAERGQMNGLQSIVVVEAKCFENPDTELNEVYTAIGQYVIYRSWLLQKGLGDRLYLAVPVHAYDGVLRQVAMATISEIRIKIIVVDVDREEIQQWLE
jgi:XisH protein